MTEFTVLVGSFSHETNTFSAMRADRAAFQERDEYFGEEVTEHYRGTNTAVGGVIDVAEREEVELLQTVAASATPSDVVTEEAYGFYTGKILDGAREHAGDYDGVILPLHGAMIPEGMDDGEGPLTADVREIVGPDIPIVVTLDLHGNITDQLVAEADALVAYEEYPHIDMGDTGRRGMELLLGAMRGEIDPVMHIERPPNLIYGPNQNTLAGPMEEVKHRARELEERENVLKVNVFPGFNHGDVPSMGVSVPVVADDDPDAARAASQEIAAMIWEKRDELITDYPSPAAAVRQARELAADLDTDAGPVVLADTGDNPGGGGAADTTPVLRELIEQEATNAGFAIIWDPAVVDQCVEAGVGERVTVDLGGKTDPSHGEPIADLDAYVKAITDGEFVNTGPMGTGRENHMGRTIRLQCGADDGVEVIVTEHRHQPLDAEIWRHVGIQPERLKVLVVKSTNHYRADYEPMASEVIPIDSPGAYAIDPRRFEYENIPRPKYPIDEMADDAYPDWD
ncbi:MAG: M81 family metallopeptidase [Halobacteriales archaeon]